MESVKDFENFLLVDMRINDESLAEMDLSLVIEITAKYKNNRLNQFTKYFKNRNYDSLSRFAVKARSFEKNYTTENK